MCNTYRTVYEAINAKENMFPGYFAVYLDGFSYLSPIDAKNSVDINGYSFVAKKTRLIGTTPFVFKMLENGNIKELLTGTEMVLLNTGNDYLRKSDLGINNKNNTDVFRDILEKIKNKEMPALLINNTNIFGFLKGNNYFSLSPDFVFKYEDLLRTDEEKLKAFIENARSEALIKVIDSFDEVVKEKNCSKVKVLSEIIRKSEGH